MSSGIRRLNYTKRVRLLREHISVTVAQPSPDHPASVRAEIDFTRYAFPVDALVFLEAYRQTEWKRFDYGTVAAPRAPEDVELPEFGSMDGVHFRVKVVAPPREEVSTSRILAQADRIKPSQDGPSRSLLPLDPDPTLRDEPWRLVIDEDDGPVVKVSTHLVRDRQAFAKSREFISLAMPEILRRILGWAVTSGTPAEDEWDTPRGKWIRLGCGLLGQAEPPQEMSDTVGGAAAREEWVDEVVSRFCRMHRTAQVFREWWREGTVQSAGAMS